MKIYKRAMILLLLVLTMIAMVVPVSDAYSTIGWKIKSFKMFVPYYGFGDTTISDFNEAMYQWNHHAGASGLTLMRREPYIRHYSTNFPENDGINRIYRVNAGSGYLAATTTYSSSQEMLSSDININVYYSWANCGQVPGCYDVWSAFLHETGHVAGLDHSTLSSAVMYPNLSNNVEKRFLTYDDRMGMKAIYGNQTVINSVPENDTFAGTGDDSVEVVSGLLPAYTLDDLVDRSNLIVRAKMISRSNPFEIKPVFGESTSVFTDYTFEIETVLKGSPKDDSVIVRTRGGSTGDRIVFAEDEPEFTVGKDVLLFLYQPGMGSGYNTTGDYYYVTGVSQGVYELENDIAIQTLTKERSTYDKIRESVETQVRNGGTTIIPREEFQDNLDRNLKNGFINEKDYQLLLAESDQYAEIVRR